MHSCTITYMLDFWTLTITNICARQSFSKSICKKGYDLTMYKKRRLSTANNVHTHLRMSINYLTISITSSYNQDCERYQEISNDWSLVNAWNYLESSVAVPSPEPAKSLYPSYRTTKTGTHRYLSRLQMLSEWYSIAITIMHMIKGSWIFCLDNTHVRMSFRSQSQSNYVNKRK